MAYPFKAPVKACVQFCVRHSVHSVVGESKPSRTALMLFACFKALDSGATLSMRKNSDIHKRVCVPAKLRLNVHGRGYFRCATHCSRFNLPIAPSTLAIAGMQQERIPPWYVVAGM